MSCTACPSWSFQDQEWQITCIYCEAWSYADETGSTSCTLASPWTYVSAPGSNSITECSPGTYQDSEGQTQCIPCEAGSYNAITWQTFCSECPIGTVNNSEWNTECERCDWNTYSDTSWWNICTSCESWFSATQEDYLWDFMKCDNQNNCSLWIFGNNICEPLQNTWWNGRWSSISKENFIYDTTNQVESSTESWAENSVVEDTEDTSLYVPTPQEIIILNTAIPKLQEFITKKGLSLEQLTDAIKFFAQKYNNSSRKYQLLMRLIEMLS